MSVLGLAFFGLLLGVRHTKEADHLAAVATLATRSRSLDEGMRLRVVWGLGHAITLFVLGADGLRLLLRRTVRFDVHDHAGGTRHLHACRMVVP